MLVIGALILTETLYPRGLIGRYYPKATWSGTPIFRTLDRIPSLDRVGTNWRGAPHSIEWSGYIHIAANGDYRVWSEAAGGAELIQSAETYLDDLRVGTGPAANRAVRLVRGFHRSLMRYAPGYLHLV